MVQIPVSGSVSVTAGLRYEFCDMFVASKIEDRRILTKASMTNHDFLPSISILTKIKDNVALRSAYGRTLVRPSYREKSPYQEQEFSGGPSFLGNAELKRSLIDNIDLRGEWFIRPGEVLSVSGFFKRIHNPIELNFLPNDVRKPVNTKSDADIYGAEFEIRKQLDMIHPLRYLQVASNLTLVHSRVELDSALGINSQTAKNYSYFPDEPNYRPFQGQSPYVINLFLTFDHPEWGTNGNITYNVFGKRLSDLTSQEQPWLWQKPEYSLTLTASQKIGSRFKFGIKASNILGADERFVYHYDGKEYIVKETKKAVAISAKISVDF
jgi:outer membrane receptor protein involved in Fe transport